MTRFVILMAFVGLTVVPTAGQSGTPPVSQPAVQAVSAVGITVSDLDQAVEFFTKVLCFEKKAASEEAGDAIEHLSGVFGARTLSAHLTLGSEMVQLTQYLAPEGRPIPADSRSNDRWFQHIAIITSDKQLGTYGAVDCGGYVATLLLAAQSLGIAAVPQAAVAMTATAVRRELNISEERDIVCAVSFGYADESHPANTCRTDRAELDDVVRWVED